MAADRGFALELQTFEWHPRRVGGHLAEALLSRHGVGHHRVFCWLVQEVHGLPGELGEDHGLLLRPFRDQPRRRSQTNFWKR